MFLCLQTELLNLGMKKCKDEMNPLKLRQFIVQTQTKTKIRIKIRNVDQQRNITLIIHSSLT